MIPFDKLGYNCLFAKMASSRGFQLSSLGDIIDNWICSLTLRRVGQLNLGPFLCLYLLFSKVWKTYGMDGSYLSKIKEKLFPSPQNNCWCKGQHLFLSN